VKHIVLTLLWFLMLGCAAEKGFNRQEPVDNSEVVIENPTQTTATIGPQGGTVFGTDGSSLYIPEAALYVETTLSLEVIESTAEPKGLTLLGKQYLISPSYLDLQIPALLTLPLTDAMADESNIQPSIFQQHDGDSWTALDTEIDNDNLLISGYIDQPGSYAGAMDLFPVATTMYNPIDYDGESLILSWYPTEEDDFESYRIYQSENALVDFDDLLLAELENRNQTTFEITGLDPEQDYYFTVFTFDSGGNFIAGELILSSSASGSICNPVDKKIVEFEDDILEQAILDQLGLQSSPMTRGALCYLQFLTHTKSKIESLSGLEYATNLNFLNLYNNNIEDIRSIAALYKIDKLYLGKNNITEIDSLSSLTRIVELFLDDNQIITLDGLSGLTTLTSLNLNDNQIRDLTPLGSLTNLKILQVANNCISNITPLSSLNNLNLVVMETNYIRDLAPLSNLTDLQGVYFSLNLVGNLIPLAGLSNLNVIYGNSNFIEDISPLASLNGLTTISFHNNRISDIAALASLDSLNLAYFGFNRIEDVQPLVDNAGFVDGDTIWLNGNPLSSEAMDNDIPTLTTRGAIVYY
jgi:internalin A